MAVLTGATMQPSYGGDTETNLSVQNYWGAGGLHSVTVNGILLHTLRTTLTPRCLFLPFHLYNEFKHSWMKF